MKKYISILFLLAFFISPFFSFAQETSVTSVNKEQCISIERNLRFGASDRVLNSTEVLELQNFLKEKGYLDAEPNGFFGPATQRAVIALQRENNLPAFGFFGPLTRELVSCKEENVSNQQTTTQETVKVEQTETADFQTTEQVAQSETETNNTEAGQNTSTTIADEIIEDLVPAEIKKTPISKFVPRIMFWPGKVNQHINLQTGLWETDPDGVSGGHSYLVFSNDFGGRELKYCQKWYPLSIDVKEYKLETLNTWKERGNVNNHTSTRMSLECVQPEITNPDNESYFFRIESPDGGETYYTAQSITLKWKNNKASEDKKVNINLLYKADGVDGKIVLLENTPNDGQENIILPVSATPGVVWGKNFKLHMFAFSENKNKIYEDFSKDFFSIESDSNLVSNNTNISTQDSASSASSTESSTTNTTTENSTTTSNQENTSTVDKTARIAYWSGKVNQHIDQNGNWQTDPDGSSGAGLDKLTYCKKWYPSTTSIRDYKTETITTWRAAGNTGAYTSARTSIECVGGSVAGVLGASINKNPNICSLGSGILMKGMKSPKVKCLQQKLNQKGYSVVGTDGGKETNEFGYYTMQALRKFQLDNNLKADGVLGQKTKNLLAQ